MFINMWYINLSGVKEKIWLKTVISGMIFSCHKVASSGNSNVSSVCSVSVLCHLTQNTFISLYLCQSNSDLYETWNLSSCAINQWSKLVCLQFGVITICLKGAMLLSSLYLCQLNSDLYETLNLSSCATNQWSKVYYLQFGVTASCLEGAILVSSYISANSNLIFMKL